MVVGDGGAFLAVLLLFCAVPLLFVALPFLLLRGAMRRGGASRGTFHVITPFGWHTRQWPAPQPEPEPYGWAPPSEPVLPAVHRADVTSLVDRLAHDVRTLDTGDDAVARQALADAAERYSTATALLERATSDAQLRTAWMTAVEGLHAARVARTQLGLPLGAPVPQLPGAGPALTSRTRLDVGGRTVVGAPTYEPGRPHWFPGGHYGGGYVPGGWYDAPFWPASLVLGGLAGALGGLALGGLAASVFADDALGGLDGGLDGGGWDGGFGGGGGWDAGSGGGWDGGWGGGSDGGSDGGFGGFGGGGDWGGDGGGE